ncbi:MAG: gamma-glutamyltransferase [Hyphomicrobiales bacterium]|nr:gamma-glutamyltransferase [Hyphomicrobiales bacterium]
MSRTIIATILFALLTSAPDQANAQQTSDSIAPEFFTGVTKNKLVKSKSWMVSTANYHASNAGREIITAGGNAVDAMVAVQLVLGLVEPQSSGLGGGAFLVYWDTKSSKLTTFDGRETAPATVKGNLFIDADGKPVKFFDAVVGGRSVGTPGTVKLLETVHGKYGKLPWERLFEPAIKLARTGFKISPRLNALITRSAEFLYRFENTRNYFLTEEGVPLYTGTLITNTAYAETLQAIAKTGSTAFYTGEIAKDIIDAVQNAPGNPGHLSLADLANYKIIERQPVCADYRGFNICGMGPPSSGALTVGQILKLVEPHDLTSLGPSNAQTWRIIGDASRLAFADRGRYIADSDFVKMPKGLLNSGYMAERRKLIRKNTTALAKDDIKPGIPPHDHAVIYEDDASLELPSTSHFSIIDRQGNVISMTTTIENGFGSRLMVRGFLLNNELTDFSFLPERNGIPIANRVEGGKRPRSSMSPTIILKNNKPVAAIGSPGGSRIIGFVAKTIIALIDWKMNIQEAIELPHLVNRFGTYDLEKDTSAEKLEPELQALGYKTKIRNLNSGLHGIVITSEELQGGADPRREGVVFGGD